jgi:hypothetical protein
MSAQEDKTVFVTDRPAGSGDNRNNGRGGNAFVQLGCKSNSMYAFLKSEPYSISHKAVRILQQVSDTQVGWDILQWPLRKEA